MLPLWIIDITKKSDRRDAFLHLAGKMEHVFIPNVLKNAHEPESPDVADTDTDKSKEFITMGDHQPQTDLSLSSSITTSEPKKSTSDVASSRTVEEKLDEEEREEAARRAIIRGDYWYYSSFDFDDFFQGIEIDEKTEAKETEAKETEAKETEAKETEAKETENRNESIIKNAEKLYAFQEAIVQTGKDFIMTLRKSNCRPYQPINIAVIGDVTEDLTRLVFASIAAILQKEKGRYLPAHIHQGMSVFGILYVPCDANTFNVEERSNILRLLNEIEVQHNLTAIRGYDHMMLYQNVQNRTECTYSLLSEEEQAQYLLQCLVHMFLACDINHPLLSGTSSDDSFYFSMGATSVFFDMSLEDENDAEKVAGGVVTHFKEDGDNEKVVQDLDIVDRDLYSAEQFVKTLNVESLDLDEYHHEDYKPHPIYHFFHKYLKKQYYLYRLRYFPAGLLREILKRIEEGTSARLDEISAHCVRIFKASEVAIHPAITRILSKVNEHDGALTYIENKFKDFEEHISKEKENIRRAIEEGFWHKILYGDLNIIPKKQRGFFEEYHEVYNSDIQSKNNGSGCKTMRDEVLANLKGLLSKERTLLSTLTRCFLLGLMCVLAILPVLEFLSPLFINLGNVHDNAFWWAIGLFLIPLFIQYIAFLMYMRKRARYIRILKAYYLHDAYARLANRIESEAFEFYDKMMALCEEYINRCKRIRREVKFPLPHPEAKMLFPVSMFNQPLNGGVFNDVTLIPAEEIEGCRVKVNYIPRFVNELTTSNYFQLINHFNDELSELFKDVGVVEYHARRFDEDKGDYIFVSRDQLIEEKEKNWENNKLRFQQHLIKGIKEIMVPRECPTVGEKLLQYKKKIDKYTLLDPMLLYAATNGEVTSEADTEYADIKVNRDIEELLVGDLPLYTTKVQISKYDEIYKKYIFVTRWRCFGHFSYNRLFPEEDFDQRMREKRIFKDEQEAKERKKKHDESLYAGKLKDDVPQEKSPSETEYILHTSSLILWAVCPDDTSNEWLKLFDSEHFTKAFNDRNTYREILNKND